MKIRLDRSAGVPLSGQLRDAIAGRIRSGRLGAGQRLPPVRQLAAGLGLAPNTVAKAYQELEAGGYLVGRGRHGTFVAVVLPFAPSDPEAVLEDAARAFAVRVRQLGASPARALTAARLALRELPTSD